MAPTSTVGASLLGQGSAEEKDEETDRQTDR